MANRTVKDAKSVRGTNPQFLIEKIIRSRIYESKYWKEECFALSAELIVDKAMELRFIGGVFGGNIKPTPFLCLTLKMLQIQPEKDIVVEFIKNEEFKYVRALGALYMRLVGSGVECYKYLEPLFNDGRKLRRQNRSGEYELIHMDEFIDELLREERSCDVILPRIQKRMVLEEANEIEPRQSAALDEDIDDAIESSSEDEAIAENHHNRRDERRRSPQRVAKPTRSEKEKVRDREYDRTRRPDREREREREREKPRDKNYRERSRSHERRHRSRSPVVRSYREKEHERDRERERKSRKEHEERREYDRRDEERREYDRRDERREYDHRNEDRREYDHRNEERREYDHRNEDRREYDHRNEERREYDHRNEDRREYDHRNEDRREYDHRNEDRREYDRREYDRRDYEREKYEQDKRRDRDRERKTIY